MRHVPVLIEEVINSLALKPGMNVIDCTLGDAGHSERILEKTAPDGKLLGIDADPEALIRAKQYLYRFGERVIPVRDNFDHLKEIIIEEKFGPINGILMDLGWSTPQFEERHRGFSFQKNDEPLDMRYGAQLQKSLTAADYINSMSYDILYETFSVYGEENLAREIARNIVEERSQKKFETVGDLVDLVLRTYRQKLRTDKEIPWIGGLHPATKVFQALRIAVNDELGVLERTLPQALDVLAPGGRLAVITFHSLEDRIVKHYFKKQDNKTVKFVNKKPIICTEAEGSNNPPSRSAKLRVVQKI